MRIKLFFFVGFLLVTMLSIASDNISTKSYYGNKNKKSKTITAKTNNSDNTVIKVNETNKLDEAVVIRNKSIVTYKAIFEEKKLKIARIK